MQPGSNGRPTTMLLLCRAQPIDQLLVILNMNLDKPYVDKTGLTGKYDYSLEFAPTNLGPPAPASAILDDPVPDLFAALPKQLGLRLDAKKLQLDVLVIDHIDKVPTEN
jgi:uncharacterized protein (TIGR03435 family)